MRLLEEPKIRALESLRANFPAGGTILDVGFGRGQVLGALLELGYRVVGTEVSEKMVRRVGGLFPTASLYTTPDPSTVREEVDCTLCFELLEHLEDPKAFLERMPRGPTFFSTPNKERWWVRLTGSYELWDFPPNHVRRFDSQALSSLLLSAGYESVRVYELPVVAREILQPFYTYLAFKLGLQVNSPDYDEVRSGVPVLSRLVELVRRLSWPVTGLIAWSLNRFECVGTSLLAYGEKK